MARRNKGREVNGILLLNKPTGASSNHILQRAKRYYGAQKAGHTGSLDPLATGMLPICFGEATKISSFLLNSDKTYRTTASLGVTTTTGDSEGELLDEIKPQEYSTEDIEQILEKYRGTIEQLPPMYSALKHQGKPLYELARKGIKVDIEYKRREVTIHQLTLLSHQLNEIQLEVHCSKGTYIRTLVEDIGAELGCGAHVSRLHRLHVSPFETYAMEELDALQNLSHEELDAKLTPMDQGLSHFPKRHLNQSQSTATGFGQKVEIEIEEEQIVRLYNHHDQFIGMGIGIEAGWMKPKRLLKTN
ncbi:MAG: tRNA pseudouridine(55) synthase TruB [Thiotrichaceae bacterium]|nr:tRNA pseudouridine(55) synthase TruB [Thiotrichaceae bacterium]